VTDVASIKPHPDFDNLTSKELDGEVERIREQIRLAFTIDDKELVAWLQTELGLCFGAMKRLNGAAAKVEQGTFWPELITAKEFLSKPPDPARWIIEDCLPIGASSVLVGAAKAGKTHLAVALCMAISRGYPVLGRGVQQGQTAYVFLDGHEDEIKEVFIKFGLTENDKVLFWAGSAGMGNPVTWAIERIQKNQVKFMVLDTFQKVFRLKNINDYSEVTNVMEPLQKARQDYGCHIEYLHHGGKPNDQRGDLDSAIGSAAIRANCYTYLHLKRLLADDNHSIRILRSDQRGGRNFEEIAISSGDDGEIEKIGTIFDAWVWTKKPEIKEFISENPGCQEKEIQLAIEGRRQHLVAGVRALLKENEIERTGIGKRGDPFRYYLAGKILVPEVREPQTSIFGLK
jgi:AAA domain